MCNLQDGATFADLILNNNKEEDKDNMSNKIILLFHKLWM